MRILVVDDDADIRLTVSTVLEAWGHRVLTASDPMKGISLLSVADVDALVLDIMMPRFTGYEMIEILRRAARTRHLPILLLSARGETKERIRGIQAGAADYLRKPFDPEELVVRVERMVAQRPVSEGGLQGDLTETGLARMLQDLEVERLSGVVRVEGEHRIGWIELEEGSPATASYGLLEDAEALLTMLGLGEGRFSFEPTPLSDLASEEPGTQILLPELAAAAARLEDELGRFGDALPAAEARLFAVRDPGAEADPEEELPYDEVYSRVESLPGITLEELVAHEFAAPVKVKLAVAVLAGRSVIEARGPA